MYIIFFYYVGTLINFVFTLKVFLQLCVYWRGRNIGKGECQRKSGVKQVSHLPHSIL